MTTMNKRILLASRPQGWVTLDNFRLVEEPVPDVADGMLLVRNLYMSVDPYMRGRMNDAKSYAPPFELGKVLEAGVVGEVVASRHAGFNSGDIVTGMLGWEEYSLNDGALLQKISPADVPLSYYLGILGMPGITAYHGLTKVGEPKEGETVFVSAASGAVGSVVGQLAKIAGCRAVGCAGSDDKVDFLINELGFDAAFNYKTCDNLSRKIREVCPDGIDVNFENVGGAIMEAVLWNMNDFGRMAMCGMIADYNAQDMQPGPRGMMLIIGRRLKLQGFIVTDNPASAEEYLGKAPGWIKSGKLKYRETIANGIEAAPEAFLAMLKGKNFGKQLVKIADK